MRKIGCKTNIHKSCCTVEHCPLVPAWATTIHKFQGFEAGHDEHDHVNYLVIDPGDLRWEQQCPGALYVALSRGKTMGNTSTGIRHPKDSAVYWSSDGMSRKRITDGSLRFDKRIRGHKIDCQLIEKRDRWVQYLYSKAQTTAADRYTSAALQKIKTTTYQDAVKGLDYTDNNLESRITDILVTPTTQWQKRRRSCLKPSSFYR